MPAPTNAGHPRAKELFDRHKLPAFHDPFAGGGSIPLEAQRLGLEAYASDLNPVAVLINKAMIEIPPKFAGKPPVNPDARRDRQLFNKTWKGAEGLAEDVRYYGRWMRDEAKKRIGHLYPKVEITAEMAKERPNLKPLVGQKLTVIAWLWARTVKSPNPAFAHVDVPLVSTFMLSTKPGKEAYVEPVIEGGRYRFTIKTGKPKDAEAAKNGTKLSRANFLCLMSGTPIAGDYIMAEGKCGRIGARMMAIVADGNGGRVYLPPTDAAEAHCTPGGANVETGSRVLSASTWLSCRQLRHDEVERPLYLPPARGADDLLRSGTRGTRTGSTRRTGRGLVRQWKAPNFWRNRGLGLRRRDSRVSGYGSEPDGAFGMFARQMEQRP